jgi:hypothetical protein
MVGLARRKLGTKEVTIISSRISLFRSTVTVRWLREEISTPEVIMLKVSAVAKDPLVSLPL